MDKEILSEDKLLYLLMGGIVSVGILFLPNAIVPDANQDSWIATIIGAIYPLYMVFLACFLKKRYPDKSILDLSKKYFGKYLGSFFNLMFGSLFMMNMFLSPSGMSNFIRAYISQFLTHIEFISIFLLLGAYGAHKGIRIIAELSKIIFYGLIVILFTGFSVLNQGSILNLQPVMSTDIKGMVNGSINSMYAYSCIELIFIIHPMFKDLKKVKKYGLLTVLASCLIYTWIVFIATFYIEPEFIKKTLWSTVYVIESINLPIINSLRFIVFFFWGVLSLKSISIYYYAVNVVLKDTFKNNKIKEYYLIIYPIAVIIASRYDNEIVKREFAGKVLPYIFIYYIVYVTLISIIVLIKKDGNCEK